MLADFSLIPIVDTGLGNSAYLLDIGQGEALVLDPELDLRRVRAEAQSRGLRIAYAVETHLHADFISGVRELSASDGATVLAPDVGERGFPTTSMGDGDAVDVGEFRLQALATPGHSPEHLSYLLHRGGQLLGVFTGGSLMVGTAGRTDLVSPDMTVPLARAQYHSLQRLMELPDDTPVWPTHGQGSFCASAVRGDRTSTIGRERATNPLVHAANEEAFVQALLGSLGSFPDYFLRLAGVNQAGPALLGTAPRLPGLAPHVVEELVAAGAQLVDVRAAADFAAAHIPGALSITFRPAFATWLGWLAAPDRPIVFVRSADQDPDDIAWNAAKVGFGHVAGELDGGMGAWAGTVSRDLGVLDAGALAAGEPAVLIDTRQGSEYAAGHVPGAISIELGALAGLAHTLPAGPVVVMCARGDRAMGAASILERSGRTGISVLAGGPRDWVAASGRHLTQQR